MSGNAASSTRYSGNGTSSEGQIAVPCKVQIKQILVSRYADNKRPLSWDQRLAGHDHIVTSNGQTIKLWSEGGQSPPRPGCAIIITSGSSEEGYKWTLYSMPK
ncbi:MAG: hypothetical protein DCC75_04710 [Proteobacteria bacterium]|nr:MAG: hypothetical protein DCC75_04710 [Pseudomonadota bacterium]